MLNMSILVKRIFGIRGILKSFEYDQKHIRISHLYFYLYHFLTSLYTIPILNPKPWTLNPEPWTLNPKPYIDVEKRCIFFL